MKIGSSENQTDRDEAEGSAEIIIHTLALEGKVERNSQVRLIVKGSVKITIRKTNETYEWRDLSYVGSRNSVGEWQTDGAKGFRLELESAASDIIRQVVARTKATNCEQPDYGSGPSDQSLC